MDAMLYYYMMIKLIDGFTCSGLIGCGLQHMLPMLFVVDSVLFSIGKLKAMMSTSGSAVVMPELSLPYSL